jgi:sugar lactone lactonase YvrE
MTAATASGLGAIEAGLEVDCRCALGECVLWSPRLQALFWTDITRGQLWTRRPEDGVARHWDVHAKLGCFGFCSDGRVLLGLAKGLSLAEFGSGDLRLTHLVDVEADIDHTRVNDGRADRHGNFVFGTKSDRDDTARPRQLVPVFLPPGLRCLALPPAAIPNSICFSHDGDTLYFCDSRVPEVLCCDYEPESAQVSTCACSRACRPNPARPTARPSTRTGASGTRNGAARA